MKYARIENGFVAEIITIGEDIEIDGLFYEEILVVPCPAEVEEGWTYDGQQFAPAHSQAIPAEELVAYAASTRWRHETAGASWNGWLIATDDRSQSKVLAELAAIDRGERADPDGWKFADGVFRQISNDDFVSLALAVRSHIRVCFVTEATLLAGIASGAITTKTQIDAVFN